MRVLSVRNVCEALPRGLELLDDIGMREESRAGPVLVAPCPVTTVYARPMERVLTAPARDANPFFHLAESMWMLAGRSDASFLNRYVRNFGERFAEPEGHIHDAYGRRWHSWFTSDDPPWDDQLEECVRLLQSNPQDRQVVLSMWDPVADLGILTKTKPCNTHIYFRNRAGTLDVTVCCRSNDIIWGACGANAVHFAFLMEYVCARTSTLPGTMYQISNNYHLYVRELERIQDRAGTTKPSALEHNVYKNTRAGYVHTLVHDPESFDAELGLAMRAVEHGHPPARMLNNAFLHDTFYRMMEAHRLWKSGARNKALDKQWTVGAKDWMQAGSEWMLRRMR